MLKADRQKHTVIILMLVAGAQKQMENIHLHRVFVPRQIIKTRMLLAQTLIHMVITHLLLAMKPLLLVMNLLQRDMKLLLLVYMPMQVVVVR
jgi:hypothetical protein